MTFKIGSYKISTREYYNALLDAGITSDAELKKIDKNKDKKISEDELEELLLEEDEEDDDSKVKEESDEDNGDIEDDSAESSIDVSDSIAMHEKQIENLMLSLSRLSSEIGTASELETLNSQLSNYENVKQEIDAHREKIFELLQKSEGVDYSDSGDTSVSSVSGSSATSGKNIKSAKGTASKIAQYGLQYAGKSQSQMQSIMTAAGNNFNWDQWCADFVTFCTRQTYGMDLLEGNTNVSGCTSGYGAWARSKGILMESNKDMSKVKPGDYILYNMGGGSFSHIGIVTAVNSNGTVDTIEGNADGAGNCVAKHNVGVSDKSFILVHNLLDKTSSKK